MCDVHSYFPAAAVAAAILTTRRASSNTQSYLSIYDGRRPNSTFYVKKVLEENIPLKHGPVARTPF